MKCPKAECGADNGGGARFCARCGTPLPPDLRVRGTQGAAIQRPGAEAVAMAPVGKSPGLALVLSVLVVGLGQLYNDDVKKGAVMFVAAVLLFVPTAAVGTLAVLVWSGYDAYQVAGGNGKRWS